MGLEKGEDAAPRADMREVGVQGGEVRLVGSKPEAWHAAAQVQAGKGKCIVTHMREVQGGGLIVRGLARSTDRGKAH